MPTVCGLADTGFFFFSMEGTELLHIHVVRGHHLEVLSAAVIEHSRTPLRPLASSKRGLEAE